MDKLLEMLGVQKLDEKEQEAIKEKLETLIELKAKEAVDELLQTEKDKLIEQYEEKFDAYKEDITSNFSNFVDEILDEQMQIPDKVLEFARKGELYADLIEQFKVRLGVDEGLLDEEVKALLKEAKSEIEGLRGKLDKKISDNLEVTNDAQELAAELYIRRKCDGLTVEQSTHMLKMLEGVSDRNEIDKKFDIVLEAYNGDSPNDDEDDEEKAKKKAKAAKERMSKERGDESTDQGKGKVLTEDDDPEDKDKDNLDEDNPFNAHLKRYLSVLQENKV